MEDKKEIPVYDILAGDGTLRSNMDAAGQMIGNASAVSELKLKKLGVADKDVGNVIKALSDFRTFIIRRPEHSNVVSSSVSSDGLKGFLSLVHYLQPDASDKDALKASVDENFANAMLGQVPENQDTVKTVMDKHQLGGLITDKEELGKQIPVILAETRTIKKTELDSVKLPDGKSLRVALDHAASGILTQLGGEAYFMAMDKLDDINQSVSPRTEKAPELNDVTNRLLDFNRDVFANPQGATANSYSAKNIKTYLSVLYDITPDQKALYEAVTNGSMLEPIADTYIQAKQDIKQSLAALGLGAPLTHEELKQAAPAFISSLAQQQKGQIR